MLENTAEIKSHPEIVLRDCYRKMYILFILRIIAIHVIIVILKTDIPID